MNTLEKFNRLYPTTKLMLFSLITGTILFALHLIFPSNDEIVIVGFLFVVGITIINFFALFHLLFVWAEDWREYEIFFIRTLILLSNIPIAGLYMYIFFNK